MAQPDSDVEQHERAGRRLRGLGFRLLGSVQETDEAVRRAGEQPGEAEVTVARLCLNTLSLREKRPRDDFHVPDLVVSPGDEHTPDQLELLAGTVGSAVHVALDALHPEERAAFVLRDGFDVSADRIADVVGLPEEVVSALADQARDAVGTPATPDGSLDEQRAVVTALAAAARRGDYDAVLALYRPDAVAHTDAGTHAISAVLRGGEELARRAVMLARPASVTHPALVNGSAGSVIEYQGQVRSVRAITVVGGLVAQIDSIADPVRIATLGVESFLAP